jgi:putative flippase GtrA
MSMFVRLLKTADARYMIGAMVSWLVYGALYIAMLKVITPYAVASGISWILSYGVVYAFQKYGTFGAMSRKAMLREAGRYVVAVVGLSAAVNFGLVTVLQDYDSTLDKAAAVAAAAVAAALVAWFVSTRILRIGAAELDDTAPNRFLETTQSAIAGQPKEPTLIGNQICDGRRQSGA